MSTASCLANRNTIQVLFLGASGPVREPGLLTASCDLRPSELVTRGRSVAHRGERKEKFCLGREKESCRPLSLPGLEGF